MVLDAILEQLVDTDRQAAETARIVEATAGSTVEGFQMAQSAGLVRESDGLAELGERLSIAAEHAAELRKVLAACRITTEDIKYSTGPRAAPLNREPESPGVDDASLQSSWRDYTGPVALALWTGMLFASVIWRQYAEVWTAVIAMLGLAMLAVTLLGPDRVYRVRYQVVLCVTLVIATAAIPVRYAFHDMSSGRLAGSVLLVVGMAAVVLMYQRKRD